MKIQHLSNEHLLVRFLARYVKLFESTDTGTIVTFNVLFDQQELFFIETKIRACAEILLAPLATAQTMTQENIITISETHPAYGNVLAQLCSAKPLFIPRMIVQTATP